MKVAFKNETYTALSSKPIGSGTYAEVWLCMTEKTHATVALKVLKKPNKELTPKILELLKSEILALETLNHQNNPNIIILLNHFIQDDRYHLVFEYCEGGDLENYIKNSPNKCLNEKEVICFLKQLLNGFKCLHENKIIHRDLKLENVLIKNGVLKISDFGFCKVLDEKSLTDTTLGTGFYMAPEVIKGARYTNKVDIWSLGICVYRMLFGVYPFKPNPLTQKQLLKEIATKPIDFSVSGRKISENFIDLLKGMITEDPRKRINWVEIYEHKVLQRERESLIEVNLGGSYLIMNKKDLEMEAINSEFERSQKNNVSFYEKNKEVEENDENEKNCGKKKDEENKKEDEDFVIIEKKKENEKEGENKNKEEPVKKKKIIIAQKEKKEQKSESNEEQKQEDLILKEDQLKEKESKLKIEENREEQHLAEDKKKKKKEKESILKNEEKPKNVKSEYQISDKKKEKNFEKHEENIQNDLEVKSENKEPTMNIIKSNREEEIAQNEEKNNYELKENKIQEICKPKQNLEKIEENQEENNSDLKPNENDSKSLKVNQIIEKDQIAYKNNCETKKIELEEHKNQNENQENLEKSSFIHPEKINKEELLQNSKIAEKNKEALAILEKKYLHRRNLISCYARLLYDGFQQNVNESANLMYFMILRKIKVLTCKFTNDLTEKINIFNEDGDIFQDFANSTFFKNLTQVFLGEDEIYQTHYSQYLSEAKEYIENHKKINFENIENEMNENFENEKNVDLMLHIAVKKYLSFYCVGQEKLHLDTGMAIFLNEVADCRKYARIFKFDGEKEEGLDYNGYKSYYENKESDALIKELKNKYEKL